MAYNFVTRKGISGVGNIPHIWQNYTNIIQNKDAPIHRTALYRPRHIPEGTQCN